MKLRITLLIPAILVISTLASSILVFNEAAQSASNTIRQEALGLLKLDITRLQNILYNRLTEDDLPEARLNLSVTAMDSAIRSLVLTDESDRVIIANRYIWEDSFASEVSRYDPSIAHQVKQSNQPVVYYGTEDSTLLTGYYPVILKLESEHGSPTKRVGILFAERSLATKLAMARREAAHQSLTFGVLMLAAAALVALLLHLLISRRLQKLTVASEALAAGNLESRALIGGNDELTQLGSSFDEMAVRIKKDIHHRQMAEHSLRDLNETLEQRITERTALLQEAQRIGHMGNWSWDVSSGELVWSDEIYRIFGYQPGEIEPTHQRFIDTLHPDDVAAIRQSEEEAFSQGLQHSIDHRIVLPDGEVRWVHEEAIPILDDAGKPVSLSGTVQDITDRKIVEQSLLKAKEEAEHANHAKSEFLSRMSHELRTPLNAILGFAQVLELGTLDADQRSSVGEITHAGEHLHNLIKDLLDLGSIEAGHLTTALQNVDATDVLQKALCIVQPLIESNQLVLNNRCKCGQSIIADRTHLIQVLVNLLSNAAKYNREGGTITIEQQVRDNNTLRLLISDTGPGIHSEQIHKLFVPFERLGAEHSGIDGTGIGLALSRQLVELMGGSIGVESTPGQGSTFWVEFPVSTTGAIVVDHTKESTGVTGEDQHTVLYIEDNAANLRLVEAIFTHYQHLTLLSATNGESGLKMAKRYTPDVILLDINLPDIDGYHVLKALRVSETTRDIPVIALSADAMQLDIEKGLAAGFKEYLTKPVPVDELVKAVKNGIESP